MKTVFVDSDTQIDFLFPAGALYVPGAEKLLPVFERLTRYAVAHGIPLLSTVDAHTENDPEFRQWPPHCVAGTAGQQKPAATLAAKRFTVPSAPGTYEWNDAEQILVEKQTLDVFANPNLPAVLDRLGADRYVVYGVVTEYCVRCVSMGLLRTGKPVELISDAVASLAESESRRTLEDFAAGGGRITTLSNVIV